MILIWIPIQTNQPWTIFWRTLGEFAYGLGLTEYQNKFSLKHFKGDNGILLCERLYTYFWRCVWWHICINLWKLLETVEDRGAWHAVVHGLAKSWTWLSNWTTTWKHIGVKWHEAAIHLTEYIITEYKWILNIIGKNINQKK